ncbi:uncharacterized protein LOC131890239 [Tigriopus californicus]|uniref:uncharacterized protein LOC131890239 n=1 Tax=Tigriopus californicus TaxID=6832 RepID=UPI0027DA41CD|nr:uncharacterized protein LOC131890239 [Tigriopus californicus]
MLMQNVLATFLSMLSLSLAIEGQIPCPWRKDGHPVDLPDANFCDRIHTCVNGFIAKTYLCQDGLVFDGTSCTIPYGNICQDRAKLQRPKGNGITCQRRNEVQIIQGNCVEYLRCVENIRYRMECLPDLWFDPEQGTCNHQNLVNREDCL